MPRVFEVHDLTCDAFPDFTTVRTCGNVHRHLAKCQLQVFELLPDYGDSYAFGVKL
jgi:hypothetical protein